MNQKRTRLTNPLSTIRFTAIVGLWTWGSLSACLDPSRYENPDQGAGADRSLMAADQRPIPTQTPDQDRPPQDRDGAFADGALVDGALDATASDGGDIDLALRDAGQLDQRVLDAGEVDRDLSPERCLFRFIFGLPAETPPGDPLYLTGDFWTALDPVSGDWEAAPAAGLLTREEQRATIELELPAFREIQYKVTRGDWTRAEVNSDCAGGEETNRRLQIFCISDEVTEIVSTVAAWSDSCGG